MGASEYAFEAREIAAGCTLHLHAFDRRKTNQLSIFWVGDLDRSVTMRALLPSLLTRGTKNFPTLRDLSRRQEFLFGAAVSAAAMKVGERHVLAFRADFANDRYLPAGESVLEPMLALMNEIVSDPVLAGGEFPADVLTQEKENHKRLIEGLFNDKRAFAFERCVQEMCAGEAFRYYEYGDVQDLPGISSADLTRLWREQRTSAETHIYFSGDVGKEEMARNLARFAERRAQPPLPVKPLAPLRKAAAPRFIEEELDVNQSRLVLGFRSATRFGDPLLEAQTIANGMLGQFPHSKLFVNVREKASLCYYAHSSLDRTQGLMFISSGIDVSKRADAERLILQQLRDLQSGEFTDEDLRATQLAYDNRLIMSEDNPRTLMDIDLTWRLAGVPYDHDRYRARLSAVTRDEVVAAARRFELDTVYFLKPRK